MSPGSRWLAASALLNTAAICGAKTKIPMAMISSKMNPILTEYKWEIFTFSYAFAPYAAPLTEITAVAIPITGKTAIIATRHPVE